MIFSEKQPQILYPLNQHRHLDNDEYVDIQSKQAKTTRHNKLVIIQLYHQNTMDIMHKMDIWQQQIIYLYSQHHIEMDQNQDSFNYLLHIFLGLGFRKWALKFWDINKLRFMMIMMIRMIDFALALITLMSD